MKRDRRYSLLPKNTNRCTLSILCSIIPIVAMEPTTDSASPKTISPLIFKSSLAQLAAESLLTDKGIAYGKKIASNHNDCSVPDDLLEQIKRSGRCWNYSPITEKRILQDGDWPLHLAYSSSGDILASGHLDSVVRLWRDENNVELKRDDRGGIAALAFHPDDSRLAVASNNSIKIWDIKEHVETTGLQMPNEQIMSIGYDHTGRWLACATKLSSIIIKDITNKVMQTIKIPSDDGVFYVAFNPRGTDLLFATTTHVGVVADITAGTPTIATVCTIPTMNSEAFGKLQPAVWSTDGRYIIVCKDGGGIRIFDAATHQECQQSFDNPDSIESVRIIAHPDGRSFFSINAHRAIQLWDLRNQQPVTICGWRMGNIYSAVVHPSGNTLVVAESSKNLQVYELEWARVQRMSDLFATAIIKHQAVSGAVDSPITQQPVNL